MTQRNKSVLDLRILPYQKEKDAYEMPAHCRNCGWRGTVLVPMGEAAPGRSTRIFGTGAAYCDRCGCSEVVVDV